MNPEQLIKLARTDPKVIIESLFWIENKQAEVVPFKFNETQAEFYQEYKRSLSEPASKVLLDILKARQQGYSSLILALFTVDFLFLPNIWCVCVSHEGEATKRLFRKVKLYLERLPFKVPMDISRADMIINKSNGSIFYIGTAGSRAFGQGDTIHDLHLSEISKYPDPEKLIKNILPAVPDVGGKIIKETTANGMNNYHHREWVKEKEGRGAFFPFFSGWNRSREYAIPLTVNLSFTTEEKELMESYRLKPEQILWRREKIKELGSEDLFREQYPINDLEAFISSGTSAFDKVSLAWYYSTQCRQPAFRGVFDEQATPAFQSDEKGYLKIWEKPMPNSLYFIPADVGKSGDFCSASVMKWGTNEQVATVNGHFEPDQFGRILYKLGAWYNYATVIPENNGIGAGVTATLSILEYPNVYSEKTMMDAGGNLDSITFGFNTNTRTRSLLIAAGQKAIRDHSPIIRDEDYISEMQSFQRNKDGKFEAATLENGATKDDRVMEFLIGQYYYQTNPIPDFSGYSRVNPMAMPDSAGVPNAQGELSGGQDFTQ